MHVPADRPRRRRLRLEHASHDVHLRLALERRAAREHLVERGAEGVDVGQGGDARRAALRLLRAHVRGRPDGGAAHRERHGTREVPGEPEVAEERAPLAVEQDVGRLHVAVHHPRRMGERQRPRQLRRDPRRLAARKRPLLRDALPQRAPLDEIHGEVHAVAVAADVVDLHEVGVAAHLGDDGGLPAEPLDVRLVRLGAGDHDLERDFAPQFRVERAVDDAHPAAAQFAQHPVGTDLVGRLPDARGRDHRRPRVAARHRPVRRGRGRARRGPRPARPAVDRVRQRLQLLRADRARGDQHAPQVRLVRRPRRLRDRALDRRVVRPASHAHQLGQRPVPFRQLT